jgi:hypothetical protein
MTIGEFRAWLEGYAENLGEASGEEVLAKVREKAGEVVEAVPLIPVPPQRSRPFYDSPLPNDYPWMAGYGNGELVQ